MTQKTVLIIEDEEDAAELFAEMMRVSGFRVLKTSKSTPAISMMTADKPDIVLLDIMMPEISGLDILRQMRRDPALANILILRTAWKLVHPTTSPNRLGTSNSKKLLNAHLPGISVNALQVDTIRFYL